MEGNGGKQKRSHFANLLSHRSVKDSFNRKLTTIEMSRGDIGRKEMQRVAVI